VYDALMARQEEWAEAGLENVFAIGDSVRPSFIADAIFSGHRLAREIDNGDPESPTPYIRERPPVDLPSPIVRTTNAEVYS
jgi:dimethylamine/trimethylamine dehydrogenase